jgi:hypothetical protein
MRFARLLVSLLVGTTLFTGQQIPCPNPPSVDDRYSVSVVDSALQFLHQFLQGKRPVSSVEMKQYLWPLLSLGDRVSIAALKIYGADELAQTENTQAYLTVVRNAFSMRSSVLEKADADPRVTLLVLAYLNEKHTSDAGIEKRIEYLDGCVRVFACSSQGEYNFFHK